MHSFGRKNDSASELESQAITPLAVNTSSPLCSPHVFFKKLKTNKEICLPAPQGFTHTPSQRCFSTPLSLASPSFPFSLSAVVFFFCDFICNQNKGSQCYRSTLCLLNQRPEIYKKSAGFTRSWRQSRTRKSPSSDRGSATVEKDALHCKKYKDIIQDNHA